MKTVITHKKHISILIICIIIMSYIYFMKTRMPVKDKYDAVGIFQLNCAWSWKNGYPHRVGDPALYGIDTSTGKISLLYVFPFDLGPEDINLPRYVTYAPEEKEIFVYVSSDFIDHFWVFSSKGKLLRKITIPVNPYCGESTHPQCIDNKLLFASRAKLLIYDIESNRFFFYKLHEYIKLPKYQLSYSYFIFWKHMIKGMPSGSIGIPLALHRRMRTPWAYNIVSGNLQKQKYGKEFPLDSDMIASDRSLHWFTFGTFVSEHNKLIYNKLTLDNWELQYVGAFKTVIPYDWNSDMVKIHKDQLGIVAKKRLWIYQLPSGNLLHSAPIIHKTAYILDWDWM